MNLLIISCLTVITISYLLLIYTVSVWSSAVPKAIRYLMAGTQIFAIIWQTTILTTLSIALTSPNPLVFRILNSFYDYGTIFFIQLLFCIDCAIAISFSVLAEWVTVSKISKFRMITILLINILNLPLYIFDGWGIPNDFVNSVIQVNGFMVAIAFTLFDQALNVYLMYVIFRFKKLHYSRRMGIYLAFSVFLDWSNIVAGVQLCVNQGYFSDIEIILWKSLCVGLSSIHLSLSILTVQELRSTALKRGTKKKFALPLEIMLAATLPIPEKIRLADTLPILQ